MAMGSLHSNAAGPTTLLNLNLKMNVTVWIQIFISTHCLIIRRCPRNIPTHPSFSHLIHISYTIRHKQSGVPLPTFGFNDDIPVLLPQMPCPVLDAREQIIDSAFKLLELAAGPSEMISIALSHVR